MLMVSPKLTASESPPSLSVEFIGTELIEDRREKSTSPASSEAQIAKGQPITVRISVRNPEQNSNEMQVADFLAIPGRLQFTLRYPSGRSDRLSLYVRNSAGLKEPTMRTLNPGEECSFEMFLYGHVATKRNGRMFENVHEYIFSEVGDYKLDVAVSEGGGAPQVESNKALAIRVIDPDPETPLSVYGALATSEFVKIVEETRAGHVPAQAALDVLADAGVDVREDEDRERSAVFQSFVPWLQDLREKRQPRTVEE